MLCESRLWTMTYGEVDEVEPPSPDRAPQSSIRGRLWRAAAALMPASISHAPIMHRKHTSPRHTSGKDRSQRRSVTHNSNRALVESNAPLPHQAPISPQMEIPIQARPGGDVPFLVPSFCQSICQHYSDLHIAGDQVLPLSADDGKLLLGPESKAIGPFLHSCDVPLAAEDSLPPQASQAGTQGQLRGGSTSWRLGSGRDRSILFQGREEPLSNSLLNRYLEHKLLDLYQQYMLEKMDKEQNGPAGSDLAPTCPLLGSEMLLTSLDQITLQLSREGNLEAGLAKDMVLSCLRRVASDMQSSEISTPFLQISNEAPKEQPSDDNEGQLISTIAPQLKDVL
ncbi:TLR adapter interacting with SLC15A4 on the lysosome [Lampris incognitus]|uniref:TLR adapter interacting with SLC15A4 on the lysosome n=1 Tax=Lampris incognitus TaxID=2546036 RepID=UPI0024B5FA5F|nr:TLR adapter interacting with SLC15A4 on the lysosome [Lampris incognitus]